MGNLKKDKGLFYKNLSYLRKQIGYSQETLAYELGIKHKRLSSWEENRAMPPIMIFIQISLFFGVGMVELVKTDLEKDNIKAVLNEN